METVARPTFVYDGDCAFCASCAAFIERRIPTHATVVPYQFADLKTLGLTLEQVESAVQWIGTDGAVASGPDAIALLLRDAGRLWRLPASGLQVPLVRLAALPAYRWVADHRHLLPGGTAVCSLPQAQRNLLYGSRSPE
jgi:predicted DCC family thiol-disulfide oxidoreductase YuxK